MSRVEDRNGVLLFRGVRVCRAAPTEETGDGEGVVVAVIGQGVLVLWDGHVDDEYAEPHALHTVSAAHHVRRRRRP